ncbi:MAG TPA: S8 family serine peptidase, partial [Verrucomicrobiae bacterium]|nr:S8 family serine peptidase [Verrucomicrobiae bacterium]
MPSIFLLHSSGHRGDGHAADRYVKRARSSGWSVFLTRKEEQMGRRMSLIVWLSVVFIVALAPRGVIAGTGDTARVIVKLVPGLTPAAQEAVVARAGGTEISAVPPLNLHVVSVAASELATVMEAYAGDPQVQAVEIEKSRKAEAVPADPDYAMQWALSKIGWESVFGTVSPGATSTVAVLDTGVDGSHPDLAGRLVPGVSFTGSSPTVDPNGHGTWTSGIIAAVTDNEAGIAGVAFAGARIMPVAVLDGSGTGKDGDIIAGIIWAADHGADVILMPFSNPDFSQNLQDALDYAWSKGAVLVAATGNGGTSTPTFPAADRGVVGVSATDENDALAFGSNYGEGTFLAAPGLNIFTTSPGGTYSYVSGTSASSAFVAGIAAFMKAADTSLSNGVIVGRLAMSADAIGAVDDPANQAMFGNGRVNMAAAVAATGTDFVEPAGAAPVGNGGPYVGPYATAANATISGDVKDDATGTGIQGATVTCTTGCNNGTVSSTTNANGFYSNLLVMYPNNKTITLTASASGYGSQSFTFPSSSTTISFRLTRTANECTVTGVTTNPANQGIDYGENAVFSAAASGAPAPTVQWQASSNGSSWSDIAGATSNTLTVTAPGVATSGTQYRAVFTNVCNGTKTATTNPATLMVTPAQLSVSAAAKTKSYGDDDPSFTYTASGFKLGDTEAAVMTGALTRVAGQNFGTYAIRQGNLSAGSNYAIAFTGADL